MTSRLKYLSAGTVETLRQEIAANTDRYKSGDFSDSMASGDWSIELGIDIDLAPLSELDPAGSPQAEIENSRLVWRALHRITPSLAYEEGIWVRLTHVECLDYCRRRWLGDGWDKAATERTIRDHFFADTLTRRRDDNAVSRLWWNAYVANLAAPGPDLEALDLILGKADIRLNFVERSATVSRPPLAGGIVRIMRREPWITDKEANFRSFMRTLNRLGGGMVFEMMTPDEIDSFMESCAARAGAGLQPPPGSA